jgi:hypothetical protein
MRAGDAGLAGSVASGGEPLGASPSADLLE